MSNDQNHISRQVEKSTALLASEADSLEFKGRTSFVYNPLRYAWDPHSTYIRTYGNGKKEILFIGMNPGPWGMAQTGIPFGEIEAVRSWLKIEGMVTPPQDQHPKKPILGFSCTRSEVSGRRLWGLMQSRFPSADVFFENHYVANYCPLIFLEEGGKNLTPDKLSAAERHDLFEICDRHLRDLVGLFQPRYLIGVGKFAARRAEEAVAKLSNPPVIDSILHPSPASPMANRGWAEQVMSKLVSAGIWESS